MLLLSENRFQIIYLRVKIYGLLYIIFRVIIIVSVNKSVYKREKNSPFGYIICPVEGNTSDSSGLEANGGGGYFKNYSPSSSYLYGYGLLPYRNNSSVIKIDYSGTTATDAVD